MLNEERRSHGSQKLLSDMTHSFVFYELKDMFAVLSL